MVIIPLLCDSLGHTCATMGRTAEPQTTITMTCDVTKETKVVVFVKMQLVLYC
jgi:hypothetical protein